jgi:hypothetical protein
MAMTEPRPSTAVLPAMTRRLALTVIMLAWVAGAAVAEPRLYASWHAPFGEPGARDTLSSRCDEQGQDTLYLSFDPGEDHEKFYAVTAMVMFRVGAGDTLSQRWWFGGGAGNDFNVRVEAGSDSSFASTSAWVGPAMGGTRYFRSKSSGDLRMVYAQESTKPSRLVKGKRYCFARIRIPHPPPGVPSCEQPTCIELASVSLAVELSGPEVKGNQGKDRFVSMNSPGGKVCDAFRAPRPGAWDPWKR